MKTITILCNYRLDPNRVGGMDRFFWLLNQRLYKLNYNVTWFFPESSGVDHYIDHDMSNIVLSTDESLLQSTTQYLRQKNGCDLLIVIFIDYNSSIPGILKKHGVKRILVIDQMSRPSFTRPVLFRLKYFIKGVINFFYIDRIIAVSQYVEKSIVKSLGFWWKPKLAMVYNGIAPEVFHSEDQYQNRKPFSIFCIAHLIKDKGVQDLLEAVSLLPDEIYKKVTLSIAGDGEYKKKLVELSKALKIDEKVQFIGNISNQQEYLKMHEVCVVPSLWKEAFGYTNVEAMASGCIVLASRIGGIPEIIQNGSNGFLFTPGDKLDLKNKLIQIFNLTPHEKNKIVKEAKNDVLKRFTLSNNIDTYLRTIGQLMLK